MLVHTTHSEDFFNLSFKEPQEIKGAASHRSMSVFLNKYAKQDYGIDGVLVSLSTWGSNLEIMNWLLDEFGGYLDENDCDDKDFYPVNIEAFEKGKDFSPEDIFVNKIIHKMGYEKLKDALGLLSEYKALSNCP